MRNRWITAAAVGLLAVAAGISPASPALAAASTLTPAPGYWFSRIDDGSTGTAATSTVPLGVMQNGATPPWCHSSAGTPVTDTLGEQWYWDECGGDVVSAAAEGIPAPPNGDKVVRWDKPAGDSHTYQKLNHMFDAATWPGSSTTQTNAYGTGQAPSDISGRYLWNQYLDSAHSVLDDGHMWVLYAEFKMNYCSAACGTGSAVYQQDPGWGFGCNDFDGPYQVSCGMTGRNHIARYIDWNTIKDAWHTFELRMFQGARDTTGHGGRAELYMDGTLLDTGYNSEFPVTASAFAPLADTYQWLFIVGQYTSHQYHNAAGGVYNEATCGGTAGCEGDWMTIASRSYWDSAQLLPLPTTAGLNASFFNNTTLTGSPVLSRVDSAGINFSWGNGSPGAGVNSNRFSARWTGYVTVPTTGTYFWCTRTDDGSRVWVNGTQVVNAWSNHTSSPPACATAGQVLTAGVQYPLTVEYYDNTGTATAAFGYKTTAAGTDVQTPAGWLTH